MSFKTSICCDGCGDSLYCMDILTKQYITSSAREFGWSVGKYHLCPECKKKRAALIKEGYLR